MLSVSRCDAEARSLGSGGDGGSDGRGRRAVAGRADDARCASSSCSAWSLVWSAGRGGTRWAVRKSTRTVVPRPTGRPRRLPSHAPRPPTCIACVEFDCWPRACLYCNALPSACALPRFWPCRCVTRHRQSCLSFQAATYVPAHLRLALESLRCLPEHEHVQKSASILSPTPARGPTHCRSVDVKPESHREVSVTELAWPQTRAGPGELRTLKRLESSRRRATLPSRLVQSRPSLGPIRCTRSVSVHERHRRERPPRSTSRPAVAQQAA